MMMHAHRRHAALTASSAAVMAVAVAVSIGGATPEASFARLYIRTTGASQLGEQQRQVLARFMGDLADAVNAYRGAKHAPVAMAPGADHEVRPIDQPVACRAAGPPRRLVRVSCELARRHMIDLPPPHDA